MGSSNLQIFQFQLFSSLLISKFSTFWNLQIFSQVLDSVQTQFRTDFVQSSFCCCSLFPSRTIRGHDSAVVAIRIAAIFRPVLGGLPSRILDFVLQIPKKPDVHFSFSPRRGTSGERFRFGFSSLLSVFMG